MSYIDNVLHFDPLLEAERTTGKSYKEDEETMKLGAGLAMLNNKAKEEALSSTDDTYYNMDFSYAVAVFRDLGFELVYMHDIADTKDTYTLWWHPDGILGKLESYYAGKSVNTANIYYNYLFTGDGNFWSLTSSGHMAARTDVDIWVGDHDVREGMRHNLNAMMEQGQFVSPWVEKPFLWLLDYTENSRVGYYKTINETKIASLPAEIRQAMGYE